MSQSGSYCSNCGVALEPGDHFCKECGHRAIPDDKDPTLVQPVAPEWPPPVTPPPGQQPAGPSGRRNLKVVALVAAAIVVAAAATGITVALTASGHAKQKAKDSGHTPTHYVSFQAEYPATKGAIAKISSVGCDGNTYVGTGFAIDEHDIVTAGHVVQGSKSMTVTLGLTPVPVQIIGLDASGDVALLRSDSALPKPYIPLASSNPDVGE
ncbi:MAG: trypsin-like peptidase domain-containing protein, partial [Acidimicrobiales bacterium]